MINFVFFLIWSSGDYAKYAKESNLVNITEGTFLESPPLCFDNIRVCLRLDNWLNKETTYSN